MRRRVGYETRYLIRLLTYLAVGLSVLLVVAAGADFRTRWARLLGSSREAAVGVALLWYRWLVPIRDARRHHLRVAAVVTEAPGVVSITVTGEGWTASAPSRGTRRIVEVRATVFTIDVRDLDPAAARDRRW